MKPSRPPNCWSITHGMAKAAVCNQSPGLIRHGIERPTPSGPTHYASHIIYATAFPEQRARTVRSMPRSMSKRMPMFARRGMDPFAHYLGDGRAEGRLPAAPTAVVVQSGLFDAQYYIMTEPDVQDAGVDPVSHYCACGETEHRRPNPYFDPAWYACHHLPTASNMGSLVHYILHGEAKGSRPSLYFDPVFYRSAYAIPDGELALTHYLRHRHLQKFNPLPLFDTAFYVQSHPGEIKPGRDAFLHYILAGASRDFDPGPNFQAAAYRRANMSSVLSAAQPAELRRNPLLHFLLSMSSSGDLRP